MESENNKPEKYQALNRSFARRIGKVLSPSRKKLLAEVMPLRLFEEGAMVTFNTVNLEIGFGMGEHFVHQIQTRPDELFIGAEVYLNGVAEVIKNAEEMGFKNYLLWPDDIDDMLAKLPDHCLDNIYILFPDPWPKRRQQKKRLVNKIRLGGFKSKLKKGGVLNFATDISDYFEDVLELVKNEAGFELISEDFTKPHPGYIVTKYNKKAIREGRKSQFLQALVV